MNKVDFFRRFMRRIFFVKKVAKSFVNSLIVCIFAVQIRNKTLRNSNSRRV